MATINANAPRIKTQTTLVMESEIIDNLKDKIDIASIRKIIEDKNVFYGNREENDLSNII